MTSMMTMILTTKIKNTLGMVCENAMLQPDIDIVETK